MVKCLVFFFYVYFFLLFLLLIFFILFYFVCKRCRIMELVLFLVLFSGGVCICYRFFCV